MPGRRLMKKRPLKKGSKRYVRKKYMRRMKSSKIPRLTTYSTGIPDKMIVKMNYEDVYNITPPGQRQWRLNSIFDPDYTGVGHQPRGHDQWQAFYQSYRVFAFKAHFFVNNTDSTGAIAVGLIPDNTAGTYTGQYLSELPKARVMHIGSEGGVSCKRISYKCSIPKVLGYTSSQYRNNEDCKSAFGTNPAEVAYLTMAVQSLNSYSGGVLGTQIRAVFTYYVELFDRVELSAS